MLCDCDKDNLKDTKLPPISLGFANDQSVKKSVFTIKPEEYLIALDEPRNGKECIFAFRNAFTYQGKEKKHLAPALADTLPPNKPNEYYMWLGTSFMRAFYVVFDQDHNSIHIADTYDIETSPRKVDDTFKYILIGLGLAGFLGATGLLLSILKKAQTIPMPPKKPKE